MGWITNEGGSMRGKLEYKAMKKTRAKSKKRQQQKKESNTPWDADDPSHVCKVCFSIVVAKACCDINIDIDIDVDEMRCRVQANQFSSEPPDTVNWCFVQTQFIVCVGILVLGSEIFRGQYGRTREAKTRVEGGERAR